MEWGSVVAGAGLAGGGMSLYVTLRFKAMIVDVLDSRYHTRKELDLKFDALNDRLDKLPCQTGRSCQGTAERREIEDLRDTIQTMAADVSQVIHGRHGKGD